MRPTLAVGPEGCGCRNAAIAHGITGSHRSGPIANNTALCAMALRSVYLSVDSRFFSPTVSLLPGDGRCHRTMTTSPNWRICGRPAVPGGRNELAPLPIISTGSLLTEAREKRPSFSAIPRAPNKCGALSVATPETPGISTFTKNMCPADCTYGG